MGEYFLLIAIIGGFIIYIFSKRNTNITKELQSKEFPKDNTNRKLTREELRSAGIRRKNEYNPSADIKSEMESLGISVSFNEPRRQSKPKNSPAYKKLTGKKAILNSFVVFDFETTGLSPDKNEIIEIGAIRVDDIKGTEHKTFSMLVKPTQPISKRITKINGIDNEMVSEADGISKAITEFYDFIGDLPLIAHNASFDMKFLLHNLKEHDLEFMDNPVVDTLYLARKAYPDLDNHKLPTLVEHIGIKVNQHHRASDDSLAALYVYTTSMQNLYGAFK